jgi:hypothetical protein
MHPIKLPITLTCLFFVLSLNAEDLTLLNGKMLKGVQVTKVEPDGLRVMHQDGLSKIPFESLPPEWKARYPFDINKAEAYRKDTAAEQQSIRAKMKEEKEKLREMELAPMKKAKEEAARTPRLTDASSIKSYWIRSLPQPVSLDRDYSRKLKFAAYMTQQIQSGIYDLDAEATALEWNFREYTRIGELERAKLLSDQLIGIKQQISERNRLRQEVELKEREFALKQQELGLQAMGISTMQDVSTALNRIAFQMLIGNVISADANGMTLQYWEITR